MGKEIKIGLGVIAVLLIVFAAVLTLRIAGSQGEIAAVDEPDNNPAEEAAPAPKPPLITPIANKVEEQKPLSLARLDKFSPASKSRYGHEKHRYHGDKKDAPKNDPLSKPAIALKPPVPDDIESDKSAGWAKIGDSRKPRKNPPQARVESSLYVLDPPSPPRAGHDSQKPFQRQYQQSDVPPSNNSNRYEFAGVQTPGQRPYPATQTHTAPPVYQNVSTASGAEARDYHSGYRNYDDRSRYNRRRSVTPPPITPQDATAGLCDNGTYEVQPNDSYWLISKRIYGSGSYFKALAEHNRKEYPVAGQLRVGDIVSTPSLAELVDEYPDFCPSAKRRETLKKRSDVISVSVQYGGGSTYKVQDGDTLYDIARYELGDASRWVEIYQLNRNVLQGDFDYLTPGMNLAMPCEAADSITQRPSLYQPHSRNILRR